MLHPLLPGRIDIADSLVLVIWRCDIVTKELCMMKALVFIAVDDARVGIGSDKVYFFVDSDSVFIVGSWLYLDDVGW